MIASSVADAAQNFQIPSSVAGLRSETYDSLATFRLRLVVTVIVEIKRAGGRISTENLDLLNSLTH
jgi:hypothetical protein